MARGLDHIVHAVRDLDAAAALYRDLGFTVGARNRHPWGTHNRLVQMPGFFIELLTFAEPDKLGTDGFSQLFAAYNRDFIGRGQGLSMLLLEAASAAADAAAFGAAGIAASPAMRFERDGARPDGSAVKVGFSLAFAQNGHAPDIHFATCQQHYPENFWSPAFQRHANGVSGVAGAVIVAERPQEQRAFFESFAGTAAAPVADGFAMATPRGAIDVMTPRAFVNRFGTNAPDKTSNLAHGARLAALRLTASDSGRPPSWPEPAAAGHVRAGDTIVIPAAHAMGAVLVFEPAR